MDLVTDSSVIIKWFYKEIDNDRALKIYNDVISDKYHLQLPEIIYYELGNVILNKKPYTSAKISSVLDILRNLNLSIYNITLNSWNEILSNIAYKYNLSFYDASYVYLADKLGCELITADKKLYEKAKKSGFVKLL